jgi:apolipoprotein N-acyltransferase
VEVRRGAPIFTTYIAMTRDAVKRGAEFVIWPESATPFMFEQDPSGRRAACARARGARADSVRQRSGGDATEPALTTRRFSCAPDGKTAAVYRKIHLVPWGEFIPMKRLLFFVSPLVDSFTDFSPGTRW